MKDMAGVLKSGLQIMRDHDNSYTLLIQLFYKEVHIRRSIYIETGNRLVKKEELAGGAKGPGK